MPEKADPASAAVDWEMELALVIAKARFGPGVDMGGKHNPRPSEMRDARDFLEAYRAALSGEAPEVCLTCGTDRDSAHHSVWAPDGHEPLLGEAPDRERPYCPCGGTCHHRESPCSLSCIAGESRRAPSLEGARHPEAGGTT